MYNECRRWQSGLWKPWCSIIQAGGSTFIITFLFFSRPKPLVPASCLCKVTSDLASFTFHVLHWPSFLSTHFSLHFMFYTPLTFCQGLKKGWSSLVPQHKHYLLSTCYRLSSIRWVVHFEGDVDFWWHRVALDPTNPVWAIHKSTNTIAFHY